MVETTARFLEGKAVAITGRLASMTRAKAIELINAFGGTFVSAVGRQTSLLVVGEEGWPFRKDGRLSNKLRKARLLQRRGCRITILPEEELLSSIGIAGESDSIRRLYSTNELTRVLGITGGRLQAWINAGLIKPIEITHGIACFDFRQVAGAKTLCDLIKSGVSVERIRRSLTQMRSWLRDIEQPMSQLALLEQNGQLLVRLDAGLAEPTGQLRLDFSGDNEPFHVSVAENPSAEEWFEVGCGHEDAGRLADAAEAYRQALLAGGPNPDYSFNLANILYGLGKKKEAVERYWQVVELDRQHAEAWNNLGNALVDLKQHKPAIAAYERALALNPADANAHYNLADLLEQTGRRQEARAHWHAYVQQDPVSQWGEFARRRLKGIG